MYLAKDLKAKDQQSRFVNLTVNKWPCEETTVNLFNNSSVVSL